MDGGRFGVVVAEEVEVVFEDVGGLGGEEEGEEEDGEGGEEEEGGCFHCGYYFMSSSIACGLLGIVWCFHCCVSQCVV